MRDFDQEFERARRRGERFGCFVLTAIALAALLTIVGAAYVLTHPEAIGSYFGRAVSAARNEQ